jgi:hypothetical protein
MIYPVITLHQPWATWIMREWKTIETRTHDHFACLKNRRILIHSSQGTDANAVNNPFLTREQIIYKPYEMIHGFILGSAFVSDFRILNSGDASKALIECKTIRYGLFLERIDRFKEPIYARGSQGIWYYDLDQKVTVKTPKIKTSTDNEAILF